MTITLKWINHASFKITSPNNVIYIDPWKLKDAPRDATIVLVSHSHYDHYSAEDIQKVSTPDTKLISSADVISQEKTGAVLEPGETIEFEGVRITGVPSYNPKKQYHPRSNNWLGFIIEIDSKRIYYAGDTDMTEEMKSLKNIDLALLPIGGTYTMDPTEAAEAITFFKPKKALPYHYGDIIGTASDAEKFKQIAETEVILLKQGQTTDL